MRRIVHVMVLLVAWLLSADPLWGQAVIVQDGQLPCAVVIRRQFTIYRDLLNTPPDQREKRPAVAQYADSVVTGAMELADYIQKSTGHRPPVLIDTDTAALTQVATKIYVGQCQQTQSLELAEPLSPEAYRIQTLGSDLFILGGDQTPQGLHVPGTLQAVYLFLEQAMGVRWLFPGELGEVVPSHRNLVIQELSLQGQPPMWQRMIRDNHLGGSPEWADKLLGQWSIPPEQWRQAFAPEVTGLWFRRQKLARRVMMDYGHSYEGWYAKHGQSHPDIFALQPDGTRKQHPSRERLCVANPQLWDLVAEDRIARLRKEPRQLVVSISPNDGGKNEFCSCDLCRAWDVAGAPADISPTGQAPPSLSDRYFRFYNEVARRVGAQMPDRYVGVYAYSRYRLPPVGIDRLEPNIVVAFVGLESDMIQAWGKLAPVLAIRPNHLLDKMTFGMPRNHGPWIAGQIKLAAENGARAFDFDSCTGNWGSQGLVYYIVAQTLWDPQADVEKLTRDYCQAAYGKGQAAMVAYYDLLADLDRRLREEGRYISRKVNAHLVLPDYYTPVLFAQLQRHLDEARAAMPADDVRSLQRLELVQQGLDYARHVMAVLSASRDARTKQDLADYAQAKARLEDVERQLALTWSVGVVHNRRYLWDALYRGEQAARERVMEGQ